MSTFTNEIVYVDNKYKTYNGFKYHLNFPNCWILDQKEDTGRQCTNCVGIRDDCSGYAMWRGIILGYCANCAIEYDYERGPGFYKNGLELCDESNTNAFDLYLGKIDFETLGDLEVNPDDTMENREKTREVIKTILESHSEDQNEYYDDYDE